MVPVISTTAVENGVLTQKFQDILLSFKNQIISVTIIKCTFDYCWLNFKNIFASDHFTQFYFGCQKVDLNE